MVWGGGAKKNSTPTKKYLLAPFSPQLSSDIGQQKPGELNS